MMNVKPLFAIIITLLSFGCGQQPKADTAVSAEPQDTAVIEPVEPVDSPRRLVEDTVCGDWHIRIEVEPNADSVKVYDGYIADSTAFITISYKGRPVITDREETVKTLVGNYDSHASGELDMHNGARFLYCTSHAVYLSFGLWMPDTDVGYYVIYRVGRNGSIRFFDEYTGIGDDIEFATGSVESFITFYEIEKAEGAMDAEMKNLLRRYCSVAFIDSLMNNDAYVAEHGHKFSRLIEAVDRSVLIDSLSYNRIERRQVRTFWKTCSTDSDSIAVRCFDVNGNGLISAIYDSYLMDSDTTRTTHFVTELTDL